MDSKVSYPERCKLVLGLNLFMVDSCIKKLNVGIKKIAAAETIAT